MKVLLVAINSKYLHTALGTRALKSYCQKHSNQVVPCKEFTINQREDEILEQLYFADAQAYFFSCYIWNIEMVRSLSRSLSKLRPKSLIFLGGPEATYNARGLLSELEFIQGVVMGEGEETFLKLLKALENGENLSNIAGVMLPNGESTQRSRLNMDSLPFCYEQDELNCGQILYYESMRGCPFSCSYCLSSVESGVRMKSVELVKLELKRFLEAKPRQVKFVDRTFNCNTERAREIWKYLIENDNGITNFHFEMAGDLIDAPTLELLSVARKGLFQFEIGVQSTNPQTLKEIRRECDLDRLRSSILAIQKLGNIHLHLDLIAGLPFENFESFVESFHWVYSMRPQQLQLGFLKVLGGSKIHEKAGDYELIYNESAPYQVLSTRWISFEELTTLKKVEHMVDCYYNSGRFSNVIKVLERFFENPFEFYQKLSVQYEKATKTGMLSKLGYYEIIGEFARENGLELGKELVSACRYDIMLHEKPKKYPSWAQTFANSEDKNIIWEFYENKANLAKYLPDYTGIDSKYITRETHLEIFDINPLNFEQKRTFILADYRKRDLIGRANVQIIEQ